MQNTIPELYRKNGQAPAILSEDGQSLTYGELSDFCCSVTDILQEAGMNRHDRIALCLPNGPVMALAFLSVISCAACAPLNPTYKKPEFLNYIDDLNCTALMVLKDDPSPAREAAQELGLCIIEISPVAGAKSCGIFSIAPFQMRLKKNCAPPCGQDTALLLHTSGTTSRPKIVPLSHDNLRQSVKNITASLQLSPQDRALNIMPYFHIHGLMVCLLAPLATGGSVICTGGLNAAHITSWLAHLKPTWYSAVPTLHQAILRILSQNSPTPPHQWRFIRSSSAALAPSLLKQMTDEYHCPVIEAYGMTEASHLIASNPLPPGKIKAGSVGLAAGPDIALRTADGQIIKEQGKGEIIIRGENVMKSYENNPAANAENFTEGWFRTGDLGAKDAHGYLSLTGRIKEIINCGGEKIMPREIDEILLEHEAVKEAVTFAAPHMTLGEQPAAALVLEAGKTLKKDDIISFVAQRLSPLKIPQIILFLDELPKGPTGKLQRIGLADILLPQEQDNPAPVQEMSRTQGQIQKIWQDILQQDSLSLADRFLEIGGDSLSAIEVMLQIEEKFAVKMSLDDLLDLPTIALLAQYIDARLKE